MKTIFLTVVLVSLAVGCGRKSGTSKETTGEGSAPGNPLTAPADYVGAVGKAKKSAEKTIAKASLETAIQHFQGQEGRNPTSLNELVTKGYMPAVPAAPRGMRFNYDPQTGEVTIVAQ